mgnify:CR=1 FL=1
MKMTPTIMSFTAVISLILTLFLALPTYSNIHNNAKEKIGNVESEDTILDEEFYDEIKQEADQFWEEVEAEQDPNDWPSGEETFYSIPFFTLPTIISAVVLIILIITGFIYWKRKKKDTTNIN